MVGELVEKIQEEEKNPVMASLAMIERLASNPNVDSGKLRELLELQKDIMNTQSKIEFDNAMARLQPLLPQILRNAKAHNGMFAKYEDVDKVVRPLYTQEGFTISFDTRGHTHFGTITHKTGYSKTVQIDFPPDKSGNKNEPQAIISALSYAKRNLLQMLLNIVTVGEDNDGNCLPVTTEQAVELDLLIKKTGVNKEALLKKLKVDDVRNIQTKDYISVLNGLKARALDQLTKEKNNAE